MIDFIHASYNPYVFCGKRCHAWKEFSLRFWKSRWAMASVMVLVACLASWSNAQSNRADAQDLASESTPIELNLRLVWGGPKPASYVGTIELESGMLVATQQLGIDPNDPSFILKDATGRLLIDDRDTRFGGCDIRVQSKSTSRLKVQLETIDQETSQSVVKEYSWTLKSLRDNPDLQTLGLDNCRLSIDRVPGDRLRVVTPRSHLIYNSEEPLSIQIQPYGLPWSSVSANIEYSIFRVDDEHSLLKKTKMIQVDGRGVGEPFDVFATAPKEEGVYELRFKLEPKRILPGLLIKQPSIERVVQFVVFNSISTSRISSPSSSHGNLQDDDLTARWRPQQQLPLKSFETQSLTAMLLSRIENARRFPLFEFAKTLAIAPKENHVEQSSEWNEERLNLLPGCIASTNITGLVPGKLHRLTLLTATHRDTYRVNVVAAGARDLKPTNEFLIQETFDAASKGTIADLTGYARRQEGERMEVLFWPTTRAAKLELINLNAVRPLGILNANVDAWQDVAETHSYENQKATGFGSVLEIHSTNIRNAFGPVTAPANSDSPAMYDDWRVFYKFAHKVALYGNANGFDCISLNVHSQGGTLFPSSKLSSNARFDTGTFSSDGRDPIRKDVVELLYRVLSRYGIQFVPMLELEGPMREVDEARTRTDSRDLMQRHEESQSYRRNEDNPYNPLSPRVQQAIAIALDEFENRYRNHAQYHGFALRASSTSHLEMSLPIDQTNKLILEQFAASVGGNLPKDLSQREQFLSQRLHHGYSQWTKEGVMNFLGKLRAKPNWISVESGRVPSASEFSPRMIAPIFVGALPNLDFQQAKGAIAAQWNFGDPMPIHIAMEKPLLRFDSEFSRLSQIAKLSDYQHLRSLPFRDASRSVSKVRVWTTREHGNSLVVANAGAVPETIRIAWDQLPTHFDCGSTQETSQSKSTRIEFDPASKEWVMQIGAGEVLRADCKDSYFAPVSWYSRESDTIRLIEIALQSLEQAITKLSTPQTRVATVTNSSFEMQGSVQRRGRLTGWTTSLDPNTNVEVDANAASDGRASIKLETNSASSIAWLQSDPFALPPSDRLYVSFQSFAEQAPSNLSLALLRFDAKSERFETIAVREFADRVAQPADASKWSTVGFDLSKELQSNNKADEPSLFRLQFEARGIGRIWLDTISLSTSFLRETERRDLRSELFLARTSLKNGDSGPAVTMLNSTRGRLVQWSDELVEKSAVLVSIRGGNSDGNDSVPLTPKLDLRQKEEPIGEPKPSDAKRRPIQRLRNSWWPR